MAGNLKIQFLSGQSPPKFFISFGSLDGLSVDVAACGSTMFGTCGQVGTEKASVPILSTRFRTLRPPLSRDAFRLSKEGHHARYRYEFRSQKRCPPHGCGGIGWSQSDQGVARMAKGRRFFGS